MSAIATAPEDEAFRAAYRDYDYRLRARRLVIACAITIFGMLCGVSLDHFVYPAWMGSFFLLRVGVDLLLLGVIASILLERRPYPRLIRARGVFSGLVVSASFCTMILLTEGARSPYIVAFNLIIMALSVLLPWSVWETSVMCVGSLLLYVAACVGNANFWHPTAQVLFAYNVSFVVITAAVCIAITFFLSRGRREDFALRHQLDVQNRKLQDLDRIKTEFFSNVSHELRTPLTLILGPVESLLAKDDRLDARTHEALILIHRNSLRLLKLINDLLDLTRIDQGADLLRKETFALGPHVKGIVESVRHLGLSKQLRIKTEEGDLTLPVTADPTRLEKVLVNLLTNAIKYTPPGGTITARWRAGDAATILEVEDTGVGIPPEDLDKVFDRFHQVRSNASNQVQGVGIGLALVRELVEQHGGRIEVESIVGHGSTFRITLPAATEPVAPPAPSAGGEAEFVEPFEKAFRSADRTLRAYADEPDTALPERGHGREVVLVADDETDMRQFVVALLSEEYRVVQTRHGGNVAALVAEHEPAVVLLDWMMPVKDGLAVCRELRANPSNRDLKIMLLTARIDEKSKLEALGSGADDFLTKPFSSVEVKTRVANLLRAARLQRDLRDRNEELSATVEKLQRTELMLIQSEKMNAIGSLSAGLLHEINNPLNYTLTAVSIAQQNRAALSPDMQELVADIEEGMGRIRDVITNLKSFAYPEKQGQLTTFSIDGIFRDACKLTARELESVRIESEIPEDVMVKGQRTQLTHLFINLLVNAAKALGEMPANAVKIISVKVTVEEEIATIEVADNGPGIPPDIIGRVFEAFFTTRDVGAGMGMGLSICHTIVESHGGSIGVSNRSSGGAVFTITLPITERIPKLC
jgi:signal transduction histidine kinase